MSTQRSPKAILVYAILGAIALATVLGLIGLASAVWCLIAVARWIGG